MNRIFSILTLLITLSCNRSNTENYPTIVIDDQHYNLRSDRKDTIPSENYIIKPTKGIVIDPTKYDFAKIRELNNGGDPDMIHILSKQGPFVTDLDPKNKIIVDSTTLRNIQGTEKFKGFNKGDTAFISIGTMNITNTVEYKTFWFTMILVQ